MNTQEAFNKMVAHLRQQQARAETAGRCRYRGSRGLKCAVGALIPDDIYTAPMDHGGPAVEKLVQKFPQIRTLFEGVEMRMLKDMQDIHDRFYPFEWEEQFALVARRYDLNLEPLT